MSEKKPISITTAEFPLSLEQNKRAKRYFLSMMLRTACFIMTVILPSPYRWVTLVLAVMLPYFAVVIANAGRESLGNHTYFKPKNNELEGK